MVKREIEAEFKYLMTQYPVVTLTGPRQSGKTTLTKMAFPEFNYCNLEHPENRKLAEDDPNAFFREFPLPLIIDEIQRVPQLLSYIQVIVDEKKKNGLFILTGSHQLALSATVTQSLAGRTALLQLLPFSLSELKTISKLEDKNVVMQRGFLPRIHDQKMDPRRAYRNYFQTYVERDLRQLIKLKNLTNFENFMKLLAGRVGQLINFTSLSNDLGVSRTTLSEWLSVLEASFIIFRLNPYYKNLGKRIIKSPKIYFVETGLAAYLLGIENAQQLQRDPLHGNLFENMVVMEAVKARLNQGKEPNLYFFRDNSGKEIDLLFEEQRKITPIEIKSAETLNSSFYKNLIYFKKLDPSSNKGILLYAGELSPELSEARVYNYTNLSEIF